MAENISNVEKASDRQQSINENNSSEVYKPEQSTSQSVNSTETTKEEAAAKNLPVESFPEEINIIRDYDWTASNNKIKKHQEIPYVKVKEFKMIGNSYISSLMTSALLYPDVVDANLGTDSVAGTMMQSIKNSFSDNKFAEFMNSVGNKTADVTNKIKEGTDKIIKGGRNVLSEIDKTAQSWEDKDLIQKYEFLFLRKPTNRKYIFPYFDNDYISVSNVFTDTYEAQSPWQQALSNVTDILNKTAQMVNFASITEPGMFIQRPKFYNFKDEGLSINVNFLLFNTLSEDAYIDNLNVITKLVIQNTPHRHNRLLVDPPCLYELTVPGRGFFPYTYIKSLEVKHLGTKRIIPNERGKNLIVPDAFEVKIVFESLTMDVNNFFVPEMGDAGIDVTQKFGLGPTVIKNLFNSSPSIETKRTSQPSPAPDQLPKNSTTPTNSDNVVPKDNGIRKYFNGAVNILENFG
jgi:hypothetical protein